MKVSYSAVSDWRQCQQLYYYRYVEKLHPRVQFESVELGTILHKYLEHFYTGVHDGMFHSAAHELATHLIDQKYREELESLASAAYAVGLEDVALSTVETLDKAIRIAERYYEVKGREDAEQYTILYCEQYLTYPLTRSIRNAAVVDLITESRIDGRVQLWEHKTPRTVPENRRRLRDLQTVLYAAMAEEIYKIGIDGVVWNYLRSKEPVKPNVLKSGGLSKDSRLDTTWEVYEKAMVEQGIADIAGYEGMYDYLKDREIPAFFPRYDLPIFQREDILLRDFIASAKQIQSVNKKLDRFVPVRNISYRCDFCSFGKLCTAVITGGDDTTIRAHEFKEKNDGNSDASPSQDPRGEDSEAVFETQ